MNTPLDHVSNGTEYAIAACAHFALPWLLLPMCLFFAWVCVSNWRVLKGMGDE